MIGEPIELMVVHPPHFDALSAYGIGGIAVVMAAVCVAVYSRGNQRLLIKLTVGTTACMLLSAMAASSGLLSRFDVVPPPMMVMIACVFALSFAIGLSPLGGIVANATSLVVLIGLQSFRFPLELVMHRAANQAIMPVQLSYSGYNFDIVTGLGAILIVVLFKVKPDLSRVLVWIWNLWGMYCLAAIAVIAITTSPVVKAFGDDPRDVNTWVLFFPYVWLPVVLVTIAISGHIIITRKLTS